MKKQIVRFDVSQKNNYLNFIKKFKGYEIIDLYEDLFIKYQLIKNPKIYFDDSSNKTKFIKRLKSSFSKGSFYFGSWIVFFNERKIYHVLNNNDYLDFRTFRNRDLITNKEQRDLYKKKILFIGMSVGSQALLTFVRTGIGNHYIIADADEIELHNLNRTNFFLDDLGQKKVNVVKKQIESIDPFINVKAIDEYITENNLENIVKGMDLIVDSFDNFGVKIMLRKIAKRMKIPVLSGFDISKGAMVISERYDCDKKLDVDFYLNGYSEKDIINSKSLSVEKKTNLFINIIGRKYHDSRMLSSVMRVGKDLSGYPQLAIATNLTSSLWTTAAIDILLNRVNKSVRVFLNLEKEIYGKLK
jgi:molybdopterin/thiamine biosynthesis adenylyltransferase